MTYRSDLLATAQKTVDGDRDKEFGDPLQNMECAAQLIGGYLNVKIDAAEVPIIQALFKIARLRENRGSTDSWVDLAGYAAVGFDVQQRSQNTAKEERPAPKKRGRPRKVKG